MVYVFKLNTDYNVCKLSCYAHTRTQTKTHTHIFHLKNAIIKSTHKLRTHTHAIVRSSVDDTTRAHKNPTISSGLCVATAVAHTNTRMPRAVSNEQLARVHRTANAIIWVYYVCAATATTATAAAALGFTDD